MKRLILGSLLFLNISCAKIEYPKTVQIDTRLAEYVISFQDEYYKRTNKELVIDNLIIQVSKTRSNNEIAWCSYDSSGIFTPVITFSPDYLNKSHSDIEQVIFHELGHCVLKIDHHNDIVNQYGVPMSIMNTFHINSYFYDLFRENYLDRLFLNKF